MPVVPFSSSPRINSTANTAMTAIEHTPFQSMQIHQVTNEMETSTNQFTSLSKQQIQNAISEDGLAKIFERAGQSDRAQHIRHGRALPNVPKANTPSSHKAIEKSNCQVSITLIKDSFTVRGAGVSCHWETPDLEITKIGIDKSFNIRKGDGTVRVSLQIPNDAKSVDCQVWYTYFSTNRYLAQVPLRTSDLGDCGVINFSSSGSWSEITAVKLNREAIPK